MSEAKEKKIVTVNRKAKFNYELIDFCEAGLSLTGSEVKSLRDGKANLVDAYISIKNNEAWLINAHINPYGPSAQFNHLPQRPRKLLLHRREIDKLAGKINEKGLSLIPTKIYFTREGKAKVEIAVGRGKKLHDKRQSMKERDSKRDIERALQRKG